MGKTHSPHEGIKNFCQGTRDPFVDTLGPDNITGIYVNGVPYVDPVIRKEIDENKRKLNKKLYESEVAVARSIVDLAYKIAE